MARARPAPVGGVVNPFWIGALAPHVPAGKPAPGGRPPSRAIGLPLAGVVVLAGAVRPRPARPRAGGTIELELDDSYGQFNLLRHSGAGVVRGAGAPH